MNDNFEVTFLGTNGSCTYNNGSRLKYGTNTMCVAVKAGRITLIFDLGSGICGFSSLKEYQNEHLNIFLSHYHIDHICGTLFLNAFFDPQKKIDMYGMGDVKGAVDRLLSPPLLPVGTGAFKAEVDFCPIIPGDVIYLQDGLTVRTIGLSHPGGAVGYRVEYDGKVFCQLTDVELSDHKDNLSLLEFIRGADLAALESSFDDGKAILGWGHSTWRESAEWAARAHVKRLALFHHSYMASDADIDRMEAAAKTVFPNTIAAADGLRVAL